MKLLYRVHRASTHQHPVKAKLASGEEVDALVHSVELELVPIDHHGGTVLHRFVGKEAEEAAKTFHQGDAVSLELQLDKPAPTVAPPPAKV